MYSVNIPNSLVGKPGSKIVQLTFWEDETMNNKLSFGVKTGYGMGMIGECLAMNTFYIYFLFFLTDAVGINAGIAGTVAMIATFWGAFTDLIAGTRTDNSTNPKGRRRPFMFKAAIPLGIITYLMYTDWSIVPDGAKPVYFTIAAMIFWLALSFTDIPYISFGSEITDDYEERTSIRGISNILNYAGMILASSGTLTIVAMLSKDGGVGDTSAWSKLGLIFGLITLAAYWIVVGTSKGREKPYEPPKTETRDKQTGFFKSCLEVIKIKPYRNILIYSICAYGGVLLFTSMYIYYLSYNVGMTEAQTATVMLVYCFMVMAVSAVFGRIKVEKKNVVVGATLIGGIVLCIGNFIEPGIMGVYIIYFAFALAISAYFVQIYSMVYDVCDIDEFKSGGGREGVIISLFYFIGKFVGGVAMAAVGWILQLSKYDPTLLEQRPETLSGISMGTLLLPGILMIIGALVMMKYPVNSKNFNALRAAIDARGEGREYSTEDFKELLK